MRVLPCVTLLLILLSGCAQRSAEQTPSTPPTDTPGPPHPPGGDPAPTPQPRVLHKPGRFGQEVATVLTGPSSPQSHNHSMGFQVDGNASALVVELVWQDPQSVIDLMVHAPGFCQRTADPACPFQGLAADPEGTGGWRVEGVPGNTRVRLELERESWAPYDCGQPPCGWTATALAKATGGTSFDFYVTVFPAGLPLPGYSAIPK